MATSDWFIKEALFPTNPNRVLACLNVELTLPLSDEPHLPIAWEYIYMIHKEIGEVLDRGMIRHSMSP